MSALLNSMSLSPAQGSNLSPGSPGYSQNRMCPHSWKPEERRKGPSFQLQGRRYQMTWCCTQRTLDHEGPSLLGFPWSRCFASFRQGPGSVPLAPGSYVSFSACKQPLPASSGPGWPIVSTAPKLWTMENLSSARPRQCPISPLLATPVQHLAPYAWSHLLPLAALSVHSRKVQAIGYLIPAHHQRASSMIQPQLSNRVSMPLCNLLSLLLSSCLH